MKVQDVSIDTIKPYENNPRKNDRSVKAVARSIEEFGFRQPIVVDSDNVIIVGHTRYRAAKMLGLKEVPVIVASDLDEEKAAAYRIADNSSGEASEWDFDALVAELENIEMVDMADFNIDEVLKKYSDNVAKKKADDDGCGEVPFAVDLDSSSNYVVLKFGNEVDWLNALTVFGLQNEMRHSTREDGLLTEGMQSIGLGRVLDGVEAIRKVREG